MVFGKKDLGSLGEMTAVNYLKKQGLRIIERNYRYLLGELDIVARDSEYLVFVEVRSRRGTNYGLPQDSISRQKKYKVRQVASSYLKHRGLEDVFVRFDVLAIVFDGDNLVKNIEHIEDAF